MKPKTTLLVAIALVSLLVSNAVSTRAGTCSNRTLSGDYGALISGTVSGLPFAALDLVHADGLGNFTGTGTVSFNGTISTVSISATYSVNADCSGTVAFSNGVTQTFVIVDSGKEVRFIRTDNPDAQVTGDAKRL